MGRPLPLTPSQTAFAGGAVGGGVGFFVGLGVAVGGSAVGGSAVGGSAVGGAAVGGSAVVVSVGGTDGSRLAVAGAEGLAVMRTVVLGRADPPGVAVALALCVPVGNGPLPPRNAAAPTATTIRTRIRATATAISRRLPDPPPPGCGATAAAPAATVPALTPEVGLPAVSFSPHWMQNVRPSGFRRPQFQQMTSGPRLLNWGDGGAGGGPPAGGGGGGGADCIGGGGGTLGGGTGMASVCSPSGGGGALGGDPAAASVSSALTPANSRYCPHDPQNSSPSWFWNPQFLQITALSLPPLEFKTPRCSTLAMTSANGRPLQPGVE